MSGALYNRCTALHSKGCLRTPAQLGTLAAPCHVPHVSRGNLLETVGMVGKGSGSRWAPPFSRWARRHHPFSGIPLHHAPNLTPARPAAGAGTMPPLGPPPVPLPAPTLVREGAGRVWGVVELLPHWGEPQRWSAPCHLRWGKAGCLALPPLVLMRLQKLCLSLQVSASPLTLVRPAPPAPTVRSYVSGVYIPGGNGVQPFKTTYNSSGGPTILWDSGAYGEL